MSLRVLGATMLVWLLMAQPAVVLADDVYSARTFEATFHPVGEPVTDYCARSGVVHTARNYGQVNAYTDNGNNDCAGPVNTLPSGWIGVKVKGLRDGASCGTSSYYYNSSPADNWQLWITMCPNPSGSQEFRSQVTITYYEGSEFYFSSVGPTSPIHSF